MSSQSLTYAVTVDATTTNVYSAGAFNNTNMMGNIIYINNEAMRVRKVSAINGSSTGDILEVTVDRAVFTGTPLEHAGTSEVQVALETNITVTGGGWEAGSYEFCHTVVDLQDNETLPQTPKSDLFAITSGAYFTGVKFRIKDAGTWRMNEKGVRIYTRKKDGNGRWILFLDVDGSNNVQVDQKGTGDHFLDINLTDNHTVDVTQDGTGSHNATIHLSGNQSSVTLTQDSSTNQNYHLQQSCSSSSCSATVTQN